MWEYIDKKNITIEDNTPYLDLRKENDVFFMHMFLQHNISAPNLKYINRCRIYLQLTTLSDTFEGDGRAFNREILHGEIKHKKLPCYHWTIQPWPYNNYGGF